MRDTSKVHAPNSSFVHSCTKLVHVVLTNYHAALLDIATILRWKCMLSSWMKPYVVRNPTLRLHATCSFLLILNNCCHRSFGCQISLLLWTEGLRQRICNHFL